jgi:rod shape-determining protein MreC
VLQFLSRYRGIIVVGVLLATPLVLLYAQTKKPGARGPIVSVFVDAAALVERALLWSAGGVMDAVEHYVTSVAGHEELVRLRRDDGSALRLQTRIAELERENESLRSLARAVENIDGPRPIGARVVGRKGAPLTRLFTLDVGGADGVRRGDGVVDRHGVVGLVLSVGRRSCDVLLLSDPSSAIDVVVQRTRSRGILRGAGSDERYYARVDDFDKLREVSPGDAIVTSGLGARFPPGVLVGTVIDAQAPDDSLYLRATVRPAASFDRIEHVAVLIDRPPPKAPRLGREAEEEGAAAPDAGPEPAPSRPAPRPKPAPPPAAAAPAPAPAVAAPAAAAPAAAAPAPGGGPPPPPAPAGAASAPAPAPSPAPSPASPPAGGPR